MVGDDEEELDRLIITTTITELVCVCHRHLHHHQHLLDRCRCRDSLLRKPNVAESCINIIKKLRKEQVIVVFIIFNTILKEVVGR